MFGDVLSVFGLLWLWSLERINCMVYKALLLIIVEDLDLRDVRYVMLYLLVRDHHVTCHRKTMIVMSRSLASTVLICGISSSCVVIIVVMQVLSSLVLLLVLVAQDVPDTWVLNVGIRLRIL